MGTTIVFVIALKGPTIIGYLASVSLIALNWVARRPVKPIS